MKKKILSSLIAMFMLVAIMAPTASAQDNVHNEDEFVVMIGGDDVIAFDESEYEGLSDYEKGAAKMKDAGISVETVEAMPREQVEGAADASYISKSMQYYIEDIDSDDQEAETEMVQVTEDEFNAALEAMDIQKASYSVQNKVLDRGPIAPAYNESDMDSGTLAIALFAVNNAGMTGALPTQHQIVCEYLWYTMPKYRGTDFLGLTNGGGITPVAGSFNGAYNYDEQRIVIFCSGSGVISWWEDGSPVTRGGSLSNQVNLGQGAVIKNSIPPP